MKSDDAIPAKASKGTAKAQMNPLQKQQKDLEMLRERLKKAKAKKQQAAQQQQKSKIRPTDGNRTDQLEALKKAKANLQGVIENKQRALRRLHSSKDSGSDDGSVGVNGNNNNNSATGTTKVIVIENINASGPDELVRFSEPSTFPEGESDGFYDGQAPFKIRLPNSQPGRISPPPPPPPLRTSRSQLQKQKAAMQYRVDVIHWTHNIRKQEKLLSDATQKVELNARNLNDCEREQRRAQTALSTTDRSIKNLKRKLKVVDNLRQQTSASLMKSRKLLHKAKERGGVRVIDVSGSSGSDE